MNIKVSQLTKQYRNRKVLDEVSFNLEGPAIIGFLGHNGAGKTSFLNMLAGLVAPSSGTIEVDGEPVFNNGELMKQICFIAETGNFPLHVTIGQVLTLNKLFFPNWNEELAEELLEQFSLRKKDKIKNMSKGMVSALGIITGLASGAPITIFDEPYIGMDASGRQLFYELLVEQHALEPRTFILSTHLIDEASNLFEDVLIMHEGKVLVHQPYEDIQTNIVKAKGRQEELEAYIGSSKVIHRSKFMNEHTAVIMHENVPAAAPASLKLESIKLQELMVLLSKNKRREIG